ncbi:MAG TPA: hypothetical protein VG328_00235 [Stellaceae bacterium]|nr:hypothetical protein [Stellaceae bacterium]
MLVGQILWVVPSDLIPAAILYVIVLFVDLARWRVLFDALFALTVTASVPPVGGAAVVCALALIAALTGLGRQWVAKPVEVL